MPEPAFSAKALGEINGILLELRTFPTLSEPATQQEFGALRASITNWIERASAARLENQCFAPILMAQVILRFNYATKVLWNYQIAVQSTMTLKQLREFLATQEEMAGANWNPRNSAAAMSSAGGSSSQSVRAEASWGEASALMPEVPKGAVKKFKSGTTQPPSKKASHASCFLCGGKHQLYKCETFLQKSYRNRLAYVRANNICPNCMKERHALSACTEGGHQPCNDEKHNSVLCPHNQHQF